MWIFTRFAVEKFWEGCPAILPRVCTVGKRSSNDINPMLMMPHVRGSLQYPLNAVAVLSLLRPQGSLCKAVPTNNQPSLVGGLRRDNEPKIRKWKQERRVVHRLISSQCLSWFGHCSSEIYLNNPPYFAIFPSSHLDYTVTLLNIPKFIKSSRNHGVF